MTHKTIPIGWIFIAGGMSLWWYPIQHLRGMQIGSAQLLFYAFLSATVCTVPWLAYQARQWKGHTPSLLIIGLSGSATLVLLNFSLFSGDTVNVFSIFCATPAIFTLSKKVSTNEQLNFVEYFSLVTLILASLAMLLGMEGGVRFHWTQLTSFLAGASCYFLFKSHSENPTLLLASKTSAIFICSTWMSGMAVIFSPRGVSFPQENAALASMLYGVLLMVPILLSTLKVLQSSRGKYFLTWLILVLVASVVSVKLL